MKRFFFSLCAVALTGCMSAPQAPVANANPEEARAFAPNEGTPIQTLAVPAIQERFRNEQHKLFAFRPSQNMPTMTNQSLLVNPSSLSAVALDEVVGTLPRIALIPCDSGCVGNPDYEKAAQVFLQAYNTAVNARRGKFTYQGVLPVKVEAFNQRNRFVRNLPVVSALGSGDLLALSLAIEGKKLQLGWENLGNTRTTMADMAETAALALYSNLLTVARGEKPAYLLHALPEGQRPEANKLNCFAAKTTKSLIAGPMGWGKAPSLLAPLTDKDRALLPAFDGIKPNELNAISEPINLATAGC